MSILLVFLVEPVKNQEMRHDMWGDPDVEHGESNPELQDSFISDRLLKAIEHTLVGEFSFHFLHVHHSDLGVLEWQWQEGGEETSKAFG